MNSYNLDIRTVCAQLNTTSRTLRYYEEKGLIKSVRDGANSSRKYEVSEVEKIRRILFLRKLGLSVEDAKSIVNVEKNTNEVIKEKYAFLFAQINKLREQVRLIEEVITVADNGGDIYKINYENPYECNKSEMTKIAESCTESFLHENFKAIFSYFHNTLADVLPVDIFKKVWENTTSVCGKFIKIEKYQLENNVIAHYLRYENTGIIIKYVFNDGQMTGIWLDYYE